MFCFKSTFFVVTLTLVDSVTVTLPITKYLTFASTIAAEQVPTISLEISSFVTLTSVQSRGPSLKISSGFTLASNRRLVSVVGIK